MREQPAETSQQSKTDRKGKPEPATLKTVKIIQIDGNFNGTTLKGLLLPPTTDLTNNIRNKNSWQNDIIIFNL